MKRVTGIGGIFFKAKDAPALRAWYKQHLGVDVQEWGGAAFDWTDAEGKPIGGTTAWSIGSAETDQFAPSKASFMVNYRVHDLHALVKALKDEGCNVFDKIDESEYGKFAWVMDPFVSGREGAPQSGALEGMDVRPGVSTVAGKAKAETEAPTPEIYRLSEVQILLIGARGRAGHGARAGRTPALDFRPEQDSAGRK